MSEQNSRITSWLSTLIKVAWLGLALVVLGDWLYFWAYESSNVPPIYRGEKAILLIWVMMFMSFPAGVLWYALLMFGYLLLDTMGVRPEQPSAFEGVLVWLGFLAFGYLQWFGLVPRIYRKLKKRQQNSGAA